VIRGCDTCSHSDGSDRCAGCWHDPDLGFASETGVADFPHYQPTWAAVRDALAAAEQRGREEGRQEEREAVVAQLADEYDQHINSRYGITETGETVEDIIQTIRSRT